MNRENKVWSLEGKLYCPTYKHEGELHYKEEDIDTLRKKLIGNIEYQCILSELELHKIINRRFGKE